ncbi:hypothetical protein BT69DRAFT_1354178 [Atractiella rhizophila]|nr:hypothetical protein BT69DRAFT_1354178 [Atractiella rhizophila]
MDLNTAAASLRIDEDEAALYDRQIRLWGLEAQNRMRSSAVLVINLRGLATEVCKNMVLAGIGRLSILDENAVVEEDLGTGFFFREGDLGKMRVEAAQSRIKALNPRVEIATFTDVSLLRNEEFLQQFNLVCLTDSHPHLITQVNNLCRRLHVKFYAASVWGVYGYIFADLLNHEYVIEKEEATPSNPSLKRKITVKKSQDYVSYESALSHRFELSAKKLKKIPPSLWATLVLWEYQRQNDGSLPQEEVSDDPFSSNETVQKLLQIATVTLPRHGVKDSSLLPPSLLQTLSITAAYDFTPTCAVLGGVLAQDILNVVGGKEIPIINTVILDGDAGTGNVYAFNLETTS